MCVGSRNTPGQENGISGLSRDPAFQLGKLSQFLLGS